MPNTKKGDEISINENDKSTLHDAGIDVGAGAFESLASKEKGAVPADTFVDIDGQNTVAPDKDLETTGLKFVDANYPKEDLSKLAEARDKAAAQASGRDLEDEFKSELSSVKTEPKKTETAVSGSSLNGLLAKIQEKLGLKKKKVKEELGNLKKMKEGISSDISDIKTLEESERKIASELEKMDLIKEEVEAIEREVGEELKK